MGWFIFNRFLMSVLVVLVVFILSFLMTRGADPGQVFEKDKAMSEENKAALMKKFGLDLPLHEQVIWVISKWFSGELHSMKYQHWTVNKIISDTLPNSFTLGVFTLFLAVFLGVAAGVIAAIKQNTFTDYAVMSIALIGISVPTFVTGAFFILLIVFNVEWLPLSGWGEFRHMIIPGIVLSLPFAAFIARLSRVGMLEIINQDFIQTARAKGVSRANIIIVHSLKGALLPVVSYLGPAAAAILTGSFAIEKLFNIPGIGSTMVQAALDRDADIVLITAVMFSSILVFFNFLVDITYALLDPRIRLGGKSTA